jgi:hypothetical protein
MRARRDNQWRARLYRYTAGLLALVLSALWAAPVAAALSTADLQKGMSCCRRNRDCCCKKQRAGNTGLKFSVPPACGSRCPGVVASAANVLFLTRGPATIHYAVASSGLAGLENIWLHDTSLDCTLYERPPPHSQS